MYLFRANVYGGPLHNNVMDCGGASSHIISPHLPPMTFLTRRLTSAAASLLPRHLLHNISPAMSHLPRCLLHNVSSSRHLSCDVSPLNVSPLYISSLRLSCDVSPIATSLLVTSLMQHHVSRATSLLATSLLQCLLPLVSPPVTSLARRVLLTTSLPQHLLLTTSIFSIKLLFLGQ